MDRQESHFFTTARTLFTALDLLLCKKAHSKTSVHCSHGITDARVYFEAAQRRRDVKRGLLDESAGILMLQQEGKSLWLKNPANLKDLILKKA
jgi:hypothetical protein